MIANRIRVLEGPNIWSNQRILEVELPRTVTRPDSLFLNLCRIISIWDESDLSLAPAEIEILPWPTDPIDEAGILLTLTLNIQRRVDLTVSEGIIKRDIAPCSTTRLAVEIVEETAGCRAWELACELWNAALRGENYDLAFQWQPFKDLAFDACLGKTTGAIVSVARTRGIPILRLDDVSLVQLGYGNRQRRIQTAISDRSSCIAEGVSRDKDLTKSLLRRVGLPVPDGRLTLDIEDAWQAACEIGLPVVVKPRDADYGQGVSLRLNSRTEIIAAFDEAKKYSEHVIVERFLEGDHHRIMVVGGAVVAAVRFERPVVVGDGKRSVRELIDELNCDPRRGARDDRTRPWFLIVIDDETLRVLASQASGADHIPSTGTRITLRFEPRIGWGGGVFDITDDIHSDVAATVVDAVSMVGLDIAGVDLIANDISQPLAGQNGGILEVNAGPAILMHLRPFSDPPRPVPESIVSFLFPIPDDAHIPIVSLCGDDSEGTIASRISELLEYHHTVVGRATHAGVFVNRRCLSPRCSDDIHGARMLLLHPKVEAAVIEVSLDRICDQGLAFDRCRIAIVAGFENSDVGNVRQNDDRRSALEVLFGTAALAGVAIVNVDDPEIADIAERHNGDTISISVRAWNPVLEQIRRTGRRSLFVRDDTVVFAQGTQETIIDCAGGTDDDGSSDELTQLAMLATMAAGWALGMPLEFIGREFAPATSRGCESVDLPMTA